MKVLRSLYCTRPPLIPTRSVSEGATQLPRLRFGLVLSASFVAAGSKAAFFSSQAASRLGRVKQGGSDFGGDIDHDEIPGSV